MALATKTTCPDCGDAPTNHFASKSLILLDWVVSPVTNIFTRERVIGPFIYDTLTPAIYRILAWLHFGTIIHEPDGKTSSRSLCLWQEAKRRGINMWEFRLFGLNRDLFVSKWPNNRSGKEITFDGLPLPGDFTPAALAWMDDKGKIHKRFGVAGIPMAHYGEARKLGEAKGIFAKLRKPVITKPNIGSRSRHTFTHIENEEGFEKAYKSAKQLSPWVIVEEELVGMVHRATVIGGKLIGVLRRDPTSVIGDGVKTVRELIDIENTNPIRKGPIFHVIEYNSDLDAELQRQNLTLESVPSKDVTVILSQKTSRGLGGGATDVTEVSHPDNNAVFEHIARVLDYPVVGIDFIIDDISRSWKDETLCGVIECNSLPFIDLHVYPLIGKPRNTPGALWELIYPGSSPRT